MLQLIKAHRMWFCSAVLSSTLRPLRWTEGYRGEGCEGVTMQAPRCSVNRWKGVGGGGGG